MQRLRSIPEALETAKQRLTALASWLKMYNREIEGRRMNQLHSKETSIHGITSVAGEEDENTKPGDRAIPEKQTGEDTTAMLSG